MDQFSRNVKLTTTITIIIITTTTYPLSIFFMILGQKSDGILNSLVKISTKCY